MSGDILRAMIVFGCSAVTVVRSGGASPSMASAASSQSPSASRSSKPVRTGRGFAGAPRPAIGGRGLTGTWRAYRDFENKYRTVALFVTPVEARLQFPHAWSVSSRLPTYARLTSLGTGGGVSFQRGSRLPKMQG